MSDIAAELLETLVSDVDVATIAAEYLLKWEELSPFLGLTPQHEIEVRNDFKVYHQKRQVLLKWRMIKGNGVTYRAFISAATAASNKELVDNVKAMLKTRTGNTTPYHLGLGLYT